MGLAIADKPDSQDICFVPEGRYTTIIDRLGSAGRAGGDIVHLDGRVLGRHPGIAGFTVGQRRRLGVAVGEPLFVLGLDAARREVVVGPRQALLTAALSLTEENWLGDEPDLATAAAAGKPVLARVRSSRPPVLARLRQSPAGSDVARWSTTRRKRPFLRARRASCTTRPSRSGSSAVVSSPPLSAGQPRTRALPHYVVL